MAPPRIVFPGIGLTGPPMARNILKAGEPGDQWPKIALLRDFRALPCQRGGAGVGHGGSFPQLDGTNQHTDQAGYP